MCERYYLRTALRRVPGTGSLLCKLLFIDSAKLPPNGFLAPPLQRFAQILADSGMVKHLEACHPSVCSPIRGFSLHLQDQQG